MLKHFVSRAANPLSYIKRSSRTNVVTIEKIWIFELGQKSGDGVAKNVVVFFYKDINKWTTRKQ